MHNGQPVAADDGFVKPAVGRGSGSMVCAGYAQRRPSWLVLGLGSGSVLDSSGPGLGPIVWACTAAMRCW